MPILSESIKSRPAEHDRVNKHSNQCKTHFADIRLPLFDPTPRPRKGSGRSCARSGPLCLQILGCRVRTQSHPAATKTERKSVYLPSRLLRTRLIAHAGRRIHRSAQGTCITASQLTHTQVKIPSTVVLWMIYKHAAN